MKVCLVAPDAPPVGGITNWTRIVKKYLSKDYHEIEYVSVNTSANRVKTGKESFLSTVWSNISGLLRQRHELVKLINAENVEVVHLTTSANLSLIRDYVLLNVCRKHRIKTVYHLHFGRSKQIVEGKGKEWRLFNRTIDMADVIVAIDSASLSSLREAFPQKNICYIPNPIDPDDVRNCKNEDSKEIVFVGWVVKTKGIQELLGAWKKIEQMYPDYKMRLVGPIPAVDMELVRSLAENDPQIILQGEVTHEEALNYIGNSSIFALPSYAEGFPNVVLEAMMLRKPIVATKVGAIPEMLTELGGVLINKESESEVQQALVKLLNDKTLRTSVAKNAHQRALDMYLIDKVLPQYIEQWEK